MKAVLVAKTERTIVDRDIPTAGPGELVIKSERRASATSGRAGLTFAHPCVIDVAVSSNPKDWKIPFCEHQVSLELASH